MTDERFIDEKIRDFRENWEKSEEQKGTKIQTLIVPCFFSSTYNRIVRLNEQINKKSRDFTIEPIGNKEIKLTRKQLD